MTGRQGKWRRLLLAACWIPSLALAEPQAPIQLRTAAQEGTEPKYIAAGKGQIVGLCVDILRAVEQIDPGLRFVGDQRWKPLVRAFYELETGMEDVQCAVQPTAERERRFNFIGPPLYSIEYHFMARQNDNIAIQNWDDVRKVNGIVLVNRGFAAVDILVGLGGIEVDASSAHPELNLQKLIAGRGRLYFHRAPGLHDLLRRTGTADKIKILPQVMYSAKLYFAANKQLDSKIVERLTIALNQLQKSGDLERMIRKWD